MTGTHHRTLGRDRQRHEPQRVCAADLPRLDRRGTLNAAAARDLHSRGCALAVRPSEGGVWARERELPSVAVYASSARSSESSSALLERSGALSALAESLARVRSSSRGRLVLIGGEAGVGKTALLGNFCDEHHESARILWGACDALFTPRPLGPLLDIAAVTGGELESMAAGGARPYEVMAALLRELAARAPTIVVLEDLHWADEATLDVVRLLASRLPAVAALVLASYRDDGLRPGAPLRIVLGELPAGGTVERLAVEPLSPAAVTQLAGPHAVDA